MNKPKIVFFDCDGTLIKGNHGERLFNDLGLDTTIISSLWHNYYKKRITKKELNEKLVKMIQTKNLFKSTVEESFSNFSFEENSQEIIKYLKNNKIECVIISSGIKEFVSLVASKLKIEEYRYNTEFIYDKNEKLIEIINFDDEDIAKVTQIKEICNMKNIRFNDTFFVGDSINDLMAFEITKHGILYKNTTLKEKSWKFIHDLDQIKFLIEEN